MSYQTKQALIKRATLDFNSADAAGNTLVSAVASHRICVLGMRIMAAAGVSLSLYSGDPSDAGTEIDPPAPLAENGGYVLPVTPEPDVPWLRTEKGEALTGLLSSAVRCTGILMYYETTED